ncbi:hypothetical protein [Haloferax sp. Atlit-47N]|uniref:hypothetical protein n=1 Tax=Haloferax sp. Atlit-47N TaxID=2077199 RepID=UPI0018F4FECD|nr:hypothetical protein [Haloferax sp. Atlit-47N]
MVAAPNPNEIKLTITTKLAFESLGLRRKVSTASVPDIAQMKRPVRNIRIVKIGSVKPITEYAGS